MNRYKIVLMVPTVTEVIVSDPQAAHNEATRLAAAQAEGLPQTSVHSIECLGKVETEEIDFSHLDVE